MTLQELINKIKNIFKSEINYQEIVEDIGHARGSFLKNLPDCFDESMQLFPGDIQKWKGVNTGEKPLGEAVHLSAALVKIVAIFEKRKWDLEEAIKINLNYLESQLDNKKI